MTLEERFWAKVNKTDGCWLWTGGKTRGNYGSFWLYQRGHGKRLRRAHRVAYELAVGPIHAGLHVCHRCDNPPCVNPSHLWLGTIMENARDKIAKGRSNVGERHGLTKLTNAQVVEIRAALARGETGRSLARAYGVSASAIHRIKTRQTYRDTCWKEAT